MSRFTASNHSEAVVSAKRSDVWALLTDPEALPRLTPFLASIDADGDLWRWNMSRIPVLGVSIAPSFTERMTFDPEERIDFHHAPPDGKPERAAAEGWYVLDEVDAGTRLSIKLELCVELPLPKASKRAVQGVMDGVMRRMGERFAANLLRELHAEAVH
jgi:carbon monoxide dehydrogenase subunit G